MAVEASADCESTMACELATEVEVLAESTRDNDSEANFTVEAAADCESAILFEVESEARALCESVFESDSEADL
ncbi:hypothetical protein R54876_GBNLAHCA_01520 [Eupransor demetentiae]|uniref:Uncharacterized protein n=1 Tax=Eupransor demetentiae TaxID=3109584 RepID=A0ABP0ERE9_9LACO|nr:hypothetical protein R54876_GBNLAHCA_01520 [Lactobacillaceae bacterium LMG 33000]